MITSFDKTIATIAAGAIVLALGHFGFKLDATTQGALTTLVTAVAVYLIPNK